MGATTREGGHSTIDVGTVEDVGNEEQEDQPEPHPRFSQRREEIQQERQRRRFRRWAWVAVPVLMALVLLALAHTPLADVDEIVVEGQLNTLEDEVVTASGLLTGQPLLTLDEGAAERRIGELPWVATADVVRSWSGTVRIVVTEREPAAVVLKGEEAEPVLVDDTGRVLAHGGPVPEGLIAITGVGQVPSPGRTLPEDALEALAIAAEAPERVPGVLSMISLDLEAQIAPGAPAEGALVRFKDGSQPVEKLVALDTILTSADLTCLATIDLWVPENPTLTRSC